MAADGLLIHQTIKALKGLKGAKIGKIQALSEEEIIFHVHGKECGSQRLAISVHSNTGRIYLSRSARYFLQSPGGFVMLLRKKISQGIILDITQEGLDRIVSFTIQAVNEFGDSCIYRLQAELMGKYSNLILVDGKSGVIIDCLKRIPVFENSKRLLHPGALYELPAKPDRQNPFAPQQFDENSSLVGQFDGFSPQLSREFLYRMHNGESFESIVAEIEKSDSLYIYPKDFHVIELKNQSGTPRILPLMEGLEILYENREKKERISQQCGDVFKAVDREVKKLKKKLPKLEAARQESLGYEKYREYGDLLFAWMHEISREKIVRLPSFETGEEVEIELDMRYDLKDNANLFYKKYHKLKRGIASLQEQISINERDLAYFEQLQEQLRHCSVDDALEIRQELIDRRVLLPRKENLRRKKKKDPHILRLSYKDSLILAGKNNLQNQFITFKLANRSDLWFHVKDYHGSHVILKSENPTEDQIRFAARIAAWLSKGKDSSSVPVDYTPIHQIKKVPGAAPGFVIMKSNKTIYIDPEPEELEKEIEQYVIR